MRTQMIIVLAATASAATAQDFTLDIVGPGAVIPESQTSFELTIIANGPGTHLLEADFALTGTDSSGAIAGISWTPGSWSSDSIDDGVGWLGAGNYSSVAVGQFVLPGFPPFDVPHADSAFADVVVGVFTVDLTGQTGLLNFQLTTGNHDPYTLLTYEDGVIGSMSDLDGTLVLGSTTVSVAPAPTSFALLGLSGFVAARRRR
jgi:hypothetical protein